MRNIIDAVRTCSDTPRWGRRLEQDRRKGVYLLEADPGVGGAGGEVVVVDVEADDRGEGAAGQPDHGGHAGGGDAAAAVAGVRPDALDLADLRGDGADLGLEEHPAVLDAGVRPAGADQVGHPGP